MNIFDDIPGDLPTEKFDQLVDADNVRIERIVSKGHISPSSGWYDQAQDEWVMVVKGEATLVFDDGESVDLKSGDYIDIPAHKKHKVTWTSPDSETIWLAVHY